MISIFDRRGSVDALVARGARHQAMLAIPSVPGARRCCLALGRCWVAQRDRSVACPAACSLRGCPPNRGLSGVKPQEIASCW
jgi:hypothetical protein